MITEHCIKFHGDYELLKYIIKKYKDELFYGGKVAPFLRNNGYSPYMYKTWKREGVHNRVWNILHKDIVIARLMGRIRDEDVMNLFELEKEFENLKK